MEDFIQFWYCHNLCFFTWILIQDAPRCHCESFSLLLSLQNILSPAHTPVYGTKLPNIATYCLWQTIWLNIYLIRKGTQSRQSYLLYLFSLSLSPARKLSAQIIQVTNGTCQFGQYFLSTLYELICKQDILLSAALCIELSLMPLISSFMHPHRE